MVPFPYLLAAGGAYLFTRRDKKKKTPRNPVVRHAQARGAGRLAGMPRRMSPTRLVKGAVAGVLPRLAPKRN